MKSSRASVACSGQAEMGSGVLRPNMIRTTASCAWQLLRSGTEWVSHLPRVTQLQRPPQSSFLCCLLELGGSIYLLWVQLCQV